MIIFACLFACLPLKNVSSTAEALHTPVHHHVHHLPEQRCQAHSQHSLLKMNEFVRTPFNGKLRRLNTKLKLWFHSCNSFSGNALFSLSLIIPSFALISLAALILAPGNAGCYKATLSWHEEGGNRTNWSADLGSQTWGCEYLDSKWSSRRCYSSQRSFMPVLMKRIDWDSPIPCLLIGILLYIVI